MVSNNDQIFSVEGEGLICDPALAFDAPSLVAFLELWTALSQAAGGVPSRRMMTARVLRNYLTDLLLVERVEADAGHRFRVRLIGTRVSAIIGDVTGKFFDEFVPEALLPRWDGVNDRVLSCGKPLRFKGRVLINDKTNLIAEYISAPLADEADRANMVLTAFSFTDTSQFEPAMSALRSRLQHA